jgi:hypothetical protein
MHLGRGEQQNRDGGQRTPEIFAAGEVPLRRKTATAIPVTAGSTVLVTASSVAVMRFSAASEKAERD